jgi:hypothetical protein
MDECTTSTTSSCSYNCAMDASHRRRSPNAASPFLAASHRRSSWRRVRLRRPYGSEQGRRRTPRRPHGSERGRRRTPRRPAAPAPSRCSRRPPPAPPSAMDRGASPARGSAGMKDAPTASDEDAVRLPVAPLQLLPAPWIEVEGETDSLDFASLLHLCRKRAAQVRALSLPK